MLLYMGLYILSAPPRPSLHPSFQGPLPSASRTASADQTLTRPYPPPAHPVLWLQREPSTAFLVFDSLSGASAAGSPGYVPGGIYVATPSGPIGGTTTYLGRDDVYKWLRETLVFPAWSDPGARRPATPRKVVRLRRIVQ